MTPADQAIIDDPWRVHARDELWRPRFVRTGQRLAVPLAGCASVVSIQHEHLSPLQDDPSLSPWEVVRASLTQPAADGGHEGAGPARWCGPWGKPARWHDVEAHNVWFVLGPWCGHRSRTVARYDFACGAAPLVPVPLAPLAASGGQATCSRSTWGSWRRAWYLPRPPGGAAGARGVGGGAAGRRLASAGAENCLL